MDDDMPQSSAIRQDVKADLDNFAVTIELTLISIIQGVALAVLATSALAPIVNVRWEFWPYIATGLLTILIFWSRAVTHVLSVIDWPLEFGHNFLYFGATLFEALALSQVAHVPNWFALNTAYAASVWLLYWYDLHMLARHAPGTVGTAARRLMEDARADQLLNVRVLMPLAVVFHLAAWVVVTRWPDPFLTRHWHVALGLWQVAIGIWYLRQGLPELGERRELIFQRALERRLGITEPAHARTV